MPSTWKVGSETIPLQTVSANAPHRDPTLVGLLDYLGFWIKTSLDTRLSEFQGPNDSSIISDACPTGHRFPWNHNGTFARPQKVDDAGTMSVPLPGLWAWVTSETATDEGATLLCEAVLSRVVRVDYIFPELQLPDGINARSGLINSIGRTIALALDQGRHASYGYGSDADGTPICQSLRLLGARFVSGEPKGIITRPTSSTAGAQGHARSDGAVQRFFPVYEATIHVLERVDPRAVVLPDDRLIEGTLTIAQGDDATDALDVLDRILSPAPDP